MDLSVITICLNDKDIERTCKSIVSQNFNNFEWIIIDGKSDKKTLKTILKYKNKIAKFISEYDCGIYDAMNKGILHSKGKYISFMNAGDCFYDKNTIKYCFSKIKDEDIIYGNVNIIKNKKSFIEYNPSNITKQFFINGTINHQSCFIKRSLFMKYGLYDLKYKIASDYEKFLLFKSFNCKFKYINKIIAKHYRNGISSDKCKVKTEREIIKKQYFSNSEIKKLNTKFYINFFGLNILSIKENFPKTYIKIFGMITLFKLKKNLIYLFGFNFLPILKLKGNTNE